MKNILLLTIIFTLSHTVHAAGMNDDPLLTKVMFDEFEVHDAEGKNPIVWDAQAWIGKDLNKLWIKTEGEYIDGKAEEAELQLLYSRAIAPYWDLQLGARRDFRPIPTRSWFAVGVQGLAPYFFEIDTTLFIGEEGRTSLRFSAEYEWMLTQKWVLSPEVEINLFGKSDEPTGTGSGLSDISAGLRLRYEFYREFAPYVGINWSKKFGKTADFAQEEGEDTDDIQFVAGVRFWF